MFEDLFLKIQMFLVMLSLVYITAVYAFVYKKPLRQSLWKASDYGYFVVAIFAATLGIIEQSSGELQSQIVEQRMERNDLAGLIANRLTSFQDACRQQADEDRIEQERRDGVYRSYGQPKSFIPPRLSEDVCRYVDNALVGSGHSMYDELSAWKFINPAEFNFDEDSSMRECAPYYLPPSSEQGVYQSQLLEPSERMRTVCQETRLTHERLAGLEPFGPFDGYWPLLLGLAFGVRLARVQADVRDALEKERSSPDYKFHAIIEGTTTAPALSEPYEPYECDKEEGAQAADQQGGQGPNREQV